MSASKNPGSIKKRYDHPTFETAMRNELKSTINYNGNLIDPETPVATSANRSLRFGDGIFETMYWDGQKIRNLDFHFDRLFKGLTVLQIDVSNGFTREFLSQEIYKICENNTPSGRARVRLNIFRDDGAFLLPISNKPVF